MSYVLIVSLRSAVGRDKMNNELKSVFLGFVGFHVKQNNEEKV